MSEKVVQKMASKLDWNQSAKSYHESTVVDELTMKIIRENVKSANGEQFARPIGEQGS